MGFLLRAGLGLLAAKPALGACGVVIGLFDVRATAFGFSSAFTIPLMQPTVGYLVAIAVSFSIGLGVRSIRMQHDLLRAA